MLAWYLVDQRRSEGQTGEGTKIMVNREQMFGYAEGELKSTDAVVQFCREHPNATGREIFAHLKNIVNTSRPGEISKKISESKLVAVKVA